MSEVPILNAPERFNALGGVLAEVSEVLDRLLRDDILTTNFMQAEASVRKYVPAYCFDFVRNASSAERFEDMSADHRRLIDTISSYLQRTGAASHGISLVSELRSKLAPYPKGTAAHAAETRILHMRRMLNLGWGLLAEAAKDGLCPIDRELGRCCEDVLSATRPSLAYSPRGDVIQFAASILEVHSMLREAEIVRKFLSNSFLVHAAGMPLCHA
jgi:hypothetical protein